MKKSVFVLGITMASLLIAGCDNTRVRHANMTVGDSVYRTRIVFTDTDRVAIQEWYRLHPHTLPPGLAKKGKVPPGHAMRLRPYDPLPSQITLAALPPELEMRLTPLPKGHSRGIIGKDVVIVDKKGRIVLDVLPDVIVIR